MAELKRLNHQAVQVVTDPQITLDGIVQQQQNIGELRAIEHIQGLAENQIAQLQQELVSLEEQR
jgi:hypothetical protein